jgi:predicted CopG family antitoxin
MKTVHLEDSTWRRLVARKLDQNKRSLSQIINEMLDREDRKYPAKEAKKP